ncbi:hypothetical protein [Thioclava sp. GXIMD4216]|uniref:hypothetical protein n=1 Tax=Thioclava sp. GXIMD4216 TaxID=3131929 RepID=UPI0030CA909F
MQNFMISSYRKLVALIIVLGMIGVVISAVAQAYLLSANPYGGGGGAGMAILAFIGILIGGTLYVILIGGALYVGLGIYDNTKKMAELLEKQLEKTSA